MIYFGISYSLAKGLNVVSVWFNAWNLQHSKQEPNYNNTSKLIVYSYGRSGKIANINTLNLRLGGL